MAIETEARAALRELVGATDFRPGQLEAISALVEEHRRVLLVQRTGWGKSAVYFVATRLLRDRGAGPTLIVSPLLALMRNQVDAAAGGGVRAGRITSDNTEEWEQIREGLRNDEIDLLLVSPERFANPQFREDVLPDIAERVGLLVIDEAHCISDWGHDFRPDYRRITRILDLLPPDVPVLCTTATANDRVVDDIVSQLDDDLLVLRGALERTSLALDVLHLPNQSERLAWLATTIPQMPGTGIVYTLTVRDARAVAAWLTKCGIDAAAYTGDELGETRLAVEEQLLRNELKCVVATAALGMGYDKPDLAFVVHFQMPGSIVAYYQQVGRAGRALDHAYAIALVGAEDAQIQDYFIRVAFPPQEQAERVVEVLAAAGDWVPLRALEAEVNLRQSRLTNMLKVLEVEGVVERNGRKYRRTPDPWEYPVERIALVTAQRKREQERMREYLTTEKCLMEFLRHELDDPETQACGRCARCRGGPLLSPEIDRALAGEALTFLRSESFAIEPRKQWPDLTRIPAGQRAETGWVLSMYGDGGWGTLVQEQRAAGAFADQLVDAVVTLLRKQPLEHVPEWVTCVPSRRHPQMVPALATRIAAALDIPFAPVVTSTRDTRPQAEMDNSAQQFANVDGAFGVTGTVRPGPVLVVDDIVDSRWTMTVVAALLRRQGSGPVIPLALARGKSD